MLTRADLARRFVLFPPVDEAVIALEEEDFGRPLPEDYIAMAKISDGMYTSGNLSILGVSGLAQRNRDYQVQTWIPESVMIGDDGGGIAILLCETDRRIYEVEMGVMDASFRRLSAPSLEALLTLGTSLGERGGWD